MALAASTVEALASHRLAQIEQRLRTGAAWEDHGLVFTNEVGSPVDTSNLRRRSFGPLLVRSGLEGLRFHDLRHTAATLLLERNIHPKIVSEMLGHSQISTTLDLYTHVMPALQREAAAAMDSILTQ